MVAHQSFGRDGWYRTGTSVNSGQYLVIGRLRPGEDWIPVRSTPHTEYQIMDRLNGKKLLILGLARQGKALARFAANAQASVTVSDLGDAQSLRSDLAEIADLKIETVLGHHPLTLLDDCDLIAVSGGVPLDAPFVLEARRRGIPLTNDSEEFLRRSPTDRVIGITGSAGKTTTTSLVAAIGERSNFKTWKGGNIGFPLIEKVDQIKSGDLVVQELSSFQLEIWTHSPKIAAILNVTPNHLDRHKTMAVYAAAKGNLIRYQTKDDLAILSADDAQTAELAPLTRGRKLWFGLDSAKMAGKDGATVTNGRIVIREAGRTIDVMAVDAIPLIGRHNVLNVLAAGLLAHAAGIGPDVIEAAVREFEAVPHRLELVATQNGVQFINDSIATAPERALAALSAYADSGDRLILLAGGRDKNMVWEPWANTVSKQIRSVILFGALSDLLKTKLAAAGRTENVVQAADLEEAVALAKGQALAGDIVLLSPGGTSYDAFKDFEERGELFRKLARG